MGQKVSPNVLRVGIIRGWEDRWYAEKDEYVKWLHEDIKIRKTLLADFKNSAVSKIEIERTKKEIILFIHTARPAVVLGQEGKNIPALVKKIQMTIKNKNAKIKINVIEIKNPDINAALVAAFIGEQITNRASFRTVQKLAIRKALKAGAKGIKTSVSGRLGGVEMARTEGYLEGSVPLSTLRADIDYALYEAMTVYGQIGVKVWINHGEILDKNNRNKNLFVTEKPASSKPYPPRENRGPRDGNRRPNNKPNNNRSAAPAANAAKGGK